MLWHALAVNTLSEVRIRNELHEEGICSFVPVELMKSRSKLAPENYRAVALVPGYVFVESKHARQHWTIIREIKGIQRVLQNDGFWLTVGQGDIDELDALQSRLQSTKDKASRTIKRLGRGDKVRVLSGPLAGYATEIQSIKGNVAKIYARLFGTNKIVQISSDQLEAV